MLYNFESSSGKLLSFVHELALSSVVLRCQNRPHSVGAYEGLSVGCRVIFVSIDRMRTLYETNILEFTYIQGRVQCRIKGG